MIQEIESGWRPGLIGWTIAEHGRFYAQNWGFGPEFEIKVATEMAEFSSRLHEPDRHIFSVSDEVGILGTLTLDGGETLDGLTHLRWFITADRSRGRKLGWRLLNAAITTARHDEARGIYLHTFEGLEAARALYLKAGFRLVHEERARSWGKEVLEQRYDLVF